MIVVPFYVINDSNTDSQNDLQHLKSTMDHNLFYMYKYKTQYCPQKNIKHDWSICIYAHRPSDFRRPPDKYLYFHDDCKN